VSLLSVVLKQLGSILEDDEYMRVSNDNTLTTTKDVSEECKTAFEELRKIIRKYVDGRTMRFVNRLKWPYVEKKVELLRVNLDRLKSTLILMLEVLKYGRSITKFATLGPIIIFELTKYLNTKKIIRRSTKGS